MMTDDMQEYLPLDPPPPPPPGEPAGAIYGHWSSNPQWGPPSWPAATQPGRKSSGFRRTALAVFAVACVGAGGGTAWALTTTSISSHSNSPLGGTGPTGTGGGANSNPNGGGTGGTISAATIATVDSAIVDITADTASGTGQVAGTGMIITSNGEILTNNHVIDDTVNIRAQIDGAGPTYQVKVIGYDANDDVALVQLVGASNLQTVSIGDSSQLSVGDAITVIGNALGKGGTPAVVSGTVAGLGAQITASDGNGYNETLTGMIQVSAAIEPGDSGGPEVNAAGQVIGMTTAGSQSPGNPNRVTPSTTGFAIPINKAMQIVAEIRSGSGPHIHIGLAALLGVGVVGIQPTPDCAASRATNGAWVGTVKPSTPAAAAGVTVCGRITSIGGTTVTNQADLHRAMEGFAVGQTVTLTWMDASAVSHSATITLGLATFPD